MVCKRFTYAFSNFVNGIYVSRNDDSVRALFNKMTIEEHLDILSLNFQQLWYRLYLHSETITRNYAELKFKYDTEFVVDGGVRLRNLISGCSRIQKLWEIPKGKKHTKLEHDLHCAIREFCEETNMCKKQFTMIVSAPKSVSFEDANVKYTFKYHLALANSTARPLIQVNTLTQIGEIQELRWMTLADIHHVYCNNATIEYLRRAFNFMKRYTRDTQK